MKMEDVLVWSGALSLFVAVGFFLGRLVARKLADDIVNTDDTEDAIRRHGEKKKKLILDEAVRASQERYEDARRQLAEEFEVETKLYEKLEADLNERQSELDKKMNALEQVGKQHEDAGQITEQIREEITRVRSESEVVSRKLGDELARRIGVDYNEVASNERDEIVSASRLEMSRWLLDNGEQLQLEAKRQAQRVLEDVYSRYKPAFVWPKGSYTVDLPSRDICERYFGNESLILPSLMAGTMTEIEVLVTDEKEFGLKIAGGSGVDKEVIRLTLEEIVARKQFQKNHVDGILARNRRKVEKLIAQMGRDAVKQLGIPPVHPEIESLIGSLNFRTSHRQNQYFHSLEVATLAGMLADEVGVDHQLAKRSGILHDIGKALDYRIEGSHAVISGDYAMKFGEAEPVVDTVLAHHDDKIVETPFAYILKAADAMSGARPGARVDMEEGYQKRIDGIAEVVKSFRDHGVVDTAIMHAGREIHVFVDNRKVKERDIDPLAQNIARKLESDVQFPGQIRVTVVRRLEVTEVA
jgi:ribonuclease Y